MYSSEFQLGSTYKELEVYYKYRTEGKQRTNERKLLEHHITNPWNAYVTGLWYYRVRVEETRIIIPEAQ